MKKLFPLENKRIEQGLCPLCSKKISFDDFKDHLSKREFKVSGLCQLCQDKMFKDSEPEE